MTHITLRTDDLKKNLELRLNRIRQEQTEGDNSCLL